MANIFTRIVDSLASGFEGTLGLNHSKISSNAIIYANNIVQYTKGRMIQYGDRGQIVAQLENVLDILGYKTYSGYRPDGIFGNEVKDAVEEIQAKNGLLNTGSVGTVTSRLLYNLIDNDIKEASIVPNLVKNYVSSKLYPNATKRFNSYLNKNHVNVVPNNSGEYRLQIKSKHSMMTYLIGGGLLVGGILLFKRNK